MTRATTIIVLAATLATAACTRDDGRDGPRAQSVEPSTGFTHRIVTIAIRGDGFRVRASQGADGTGGDVVDARYRAWLGETELADVERIDRTSLRAVVPAGIAPGSLDLVVEDPWQRRASIAHAYQAVAVDLPVLGLAPALPVSVAVPGQRLELSVAVANGGGDDARAVTVSASPSALPGALATTPSVPQDVPAGSERAFVVALDALAPGTVPLLVTASATDAVSGDPVTATIAAGPVTVLAPAALSVAAVDAPAAVESGATFAVVLSIANAGDEDAIGVAVDAVPSDGAVTVISTPGPRDVPARSTATFAFLLAAGLPRSSHVSFSGGGTGAVSTAPAAFPPVGRDVAVLAPAALRVTVRPLPPHVSVGQRIALSADVEDPGDVGALAVSAVLSGVAPAFAAGAATPAAQDVAACGGPRTFSWTLDAVAPATVTPGAAVSGRDALTGAPIVASASATAAVVVQTAAAPLATAIGPTAPVPVGQPFTIAMTVTNLGQASCGLAPSIDVSSTATLVQTVAPDPVALGGGAATTLAWTFLAQSPGTATFTPRVDGDDVNSGAAVSASAPPLAVEVQPVPTVAPIASNPFHDGTTYTTVAAFGGKVYLGTNRTGDAALRTAPDASGAEPVGFVFEQDVTSCDPSSPGRQDCEPRNPSTAYPAAKGTSIGFAGCVSGTPQCGPDGEAGRALLFSGVMVDGQEWLFIGGGRTGSIHYLYATSSTALPLDFSYLDLQVGLLGFAQAISAAGVVGGRLYVSHTAGVDAPGTPAPPFRVLTTAPAYPGVDPPLYGSMLVDLHGEYIPGVGTLAGHPPGNLEVDALAEFGSFLYVANDGGIARSTSAPPAPASASGGAWVSCTPSSVSYAAKASIPLPGTMELEPADRAIPALAGFGGRLFAIRNTTTGPQLWRCDPGLSGDATQCDPGDWSLAAPNAAGDTDLTQLGDPGNARATLLLATPAWLYVGFNGASGIQIYRTASATPAPSDFVGQSGCAAGTPGCQGLGGAGLGDPAGNTRIYDAKVLTLEGRSAVYVSAGNGTAPVRVYRLND